MHLKFAVLRSHITTIINEGEIWRQKERSDLGETCRFCGTRKAKKSFVQKIKYRQSALWDTFPYLGSLITEDGECTTEFRTRLNRGQAIEVSLQKIWKSHNIPISTKIRLMKALVWPVATYGCESWTLRKNEEIRLDAFEMKGPT